MHVSFSAHYYVSDRCQDGWLRGMNSARKAGVFPGNHVIPLKELPVPSGVMVRIINRYLTLNDIINPHSISSQSELSNPNTPQNQRISITPATPPTSPPVLPPRNQASVLTNNADPSATVESPNDTKKEPSINLIKRITNNLKRSKSPPGNTDETSSGTSSITATPRTSQSSVQPRLLQSLHGRSGSCPSQLLDLSALKITPMGANNNNNANNNNQSQRHGLPQSVAEQQTAMSMFNSQRVRGQKERPALHSIHRQLGERKEDLTSLNSHASSSSHKKSNSLDAGRLISGPSTSGADQNGNSNSNGAVRNSRSGASGGHHQQQQVKEK